MPITVPPVVVTVPASGVSTPPISRNSVDLPSPLRPTTPMRSPSSTPRVTPVRTARAAYPLATSLRLTRLRLRPSGLDEDQVADPDPVVDPTRVRDGDAQAAVAGVEDGDRGVAVDGVAADEVVRVHHTLGVGADRLQIEAVTAEDRRRRRLARRRVQRPVD